MTIHRKFLETFSYLFDIVDSDIQEYHPSQARITGKNKAIAPALSKIAYDTPDVEVLAIRRNASDLKRPKANMDNAFTYWNIEDKVNFLGKDRTFSMPNGNKIILESVYNSQGKKALAGYEPSPSVKILIVWVDEATELSNKERSQIYQSCRLDDGGKVVYIWSSNSENRMNPYVKWLRSILVKDVSLLKREYAGEQKEVVEVKQTILGEEVIRKHLVHYANIFNNPLVPKDILSAMIQTGEENPQLKDWMIYGLDGNPSGAVYPSADNWVRNYSIKPQDKGKDNYFDRNNVKEYAGGVDYGIQDPTATAFGGLTLENSSIQVMRNWSYQNTPNMKRLELEDFANQVVLFQQKCWEEFEVNRTQHEMFIYVEYARQNSQDERFHKLCNNVAKDLGLYHLIFVTATKARIFERILMVNSLGSSGKFNIWSECTTAIDEFAGSSFIEDKDGQRGEANDHTMNAVEYMIEPWRDRIYNSKIRK